MVFKGLDNAKIWKYFQGGVTVLKSCKFSGNSREHSKNRLQVQDWVWIWQGTVTLPCEKCIMKNISKLPTFLVLIRTFLIKNIFLHPMRSWITRGFFERVWEGSLIKEDKSRQTMLTRKFWYGILKGIIYYLTENLNNIVINDSSISLFLSQRNTSRPETLKKISLNCALS